MLKNFYKKIIQELSLMELKNNLAIFNDLIDTCKEPFTQWKMIVSNN